MKKIYIIMTAVLLLFFAYPKSVSAQTHYMRVHYIQYVPLGNSSSYGECSYYEFPGADGELGTSDDRNLLIDGGRSGAADSVLIPFLKNKIGVGGTLHFMALSSAGADHYGGLEKVVDNFRVLNYYENVRWPEGDKTGYDNLINTINSESCNQYFYDAGDYLSGPGTNIGPGWDPYITARVLCANADSPWNGANDNEWGGLIQIRCGESVFLTGGDATGSEQEDWVVYETTPHSYTGAASELSDTDIYKVHHHGSKYSSYQDFLDLMSPSYAVAQMGYGSGDHPYAEPLDRIWYTGAIVYRNDLDGTVIIKCDDLGNFDINRERAYINENQTPGGSGDLQYPPPSIPLNLLVTSEGGDFISLDWDDVSGAYGYDVFRSTISNGDPGAGMDANPGCDATGIYEKVNSANLTSSQYTDSGLQPGTTYYYRVSSKETNSESGYEICYERRYSNQASGSTSQKFPVRINFQPSVSESPAPPGYLVDNGEAYGTSGVYGWQTGQ